MNNCEYVKENISAFLDNELNEEDKKTFLEHLEECEDCEKEFLLIEKLIRSLDNIEDIELPENFHNELMEKLKKESGKNIENKKNEEENIIYLSADEKQVKKTKKKKEFNYRKYISAFGAVAAIFIVAIAYRNSYINSTDKDNYEDFGTYSTLNIAESSPEVATSGRMIVEDSSADTSQKQSNAKEIQEYNINIDVGDFDEALSIIEDFDGYNSYSSMESYYGSNNRTISITRIVSNDNANETLTALESLGEVVSFSKSINRLTFEMLNIQGKIDANDTEINNLKELYKNSKSIDSMSYIEKRLYEIYHDQNYLKAELDYYKENTETSDFNININEKVQSTVTTTAKMPFGQELANTLKMSLTSAIKNLLDVVLVIANLWVPIAIVAIVIIIVKVVKKSKGGRKNEKI